MFPSNQTPKKAIYRFKFSNDLLEKITDFSKKNKDTSCKIFRHNLDNFIIENRGLINKEKEIYDDYGYKGDIVDKIYRSARYYFKNKESKKTIKNNNIIDNSNKPANTQKRKYIKRDEKFVEAVHEHVLSAVRQNIKPAIAFSQFIEHEKYKHLYQKEYRRVNTILEDDKATLAKIKKTYKNIYFTFKRSI